MSNEKYEAVIGLEVHAQLKTNTKLFCSCSTKFGMPPNTNVCPICLGHPGVLPVTNKKVIEFAVLLGLATNCSINRKSIFARKNYFYPDLPKGYQISQLEKPICEFGHLNVLPKDGKEIKIGITRIHMEEDAGKSIHDQGFSTLVDVNRCGVPLLEIVSEPDIRTAEEAVLYLTKLRQIVTYLNICDGNMEEGSLRCDANVSVRLKGTKELGTKTEIKNMNSFKNVEKAINFEIERQIEIIEDGGRIIQQTLLWNADKNFAAPMRSKEESHDYRYFPDPDLVPVILDDSYINSLKLQLPTLPDERKKLFIDSYNLPVYDSEVLTNEKQFADYYEAAAKHCSDYKALSNYMMGDIFKYLNENKINISEFNLSAINLAKLVNLVNKGTISSKIAKDIFGDLVKENIDPEEYVKSKNLIQISDTSEIEKIIDDVIDQNKTEVEKYLAGKQSVIGFFVGQIMKISKGKANPQLVNKILKEKLDNYKI
jgi:aspartyl-tRNA(Asn)/glutamyl-tRNA(Gln) amidotransferase subunit B